MSNQLTVEAGILLDSMEMDIAPLLRENGQSFDRLRSVFMIAVQQEPKILECTPESLRREVSKCAADGLVPDSKEAVLLPYWDNKEKALLANYQPMVQGIIKRVKELGGVFQIVCKLVHANDEFVLNEADPDSLVHKSDPFAKIEQRGPVTGGYAVFRDDQKRVMHLETMSLEDMLKVQQASKAPNSPAWTKWTSEMYRKAVLRRGSKYVPINNDKIRALLERQDDMFDFREVKTVERVDPFTGEVIAASTAPAIENKSQVNMAANTQERQQQRNPSNDQRASQQSQGPSVAKSDGSKSRAKKEEPKQIEGKTETEKEPAKVPALPDISVKKEDRDQLIESAQKILRIGLEMEIAPNERRKILKSASLDHKENNPEYLHPLLKAFIEATDWAIKTDDAGKPWAADHAMFVHKVKSLLDVEKLEIGKYP